MRKMLFLLLLISFSFVNISSDIFTTNLFKLARAYDLKGDYKQAIEYYEKFIISENDKSLVEKVTLRIARITSIPKDSIIKYLQFIKDYPRSKYRFIARYELATIYKITNDKKNAEQQFKILAKEGVGTPYWQKALLEVIHIEYQNNRFREALQNVYILLDKIEDYEDVSKSYFLLGLIMLKQKQYDDAEEFFLICAGSFPKSTCAPSSLLSLVKMYSKQKEYAKASSADRILSQLYTNSLEEVESKKIVKKYRNKIKKGSVLPEINLINLNDNANLKDKVLLKIKKEIDDSLTGITNEITAETTKDSSDDTMVNKSGFYIQLGYYSSLESAKDFIDECTNKKKIDGVYYAKTFSTKTDKVFYRIVIGPFPTRGGANNKLIELKEKNIEAIVLELTQDYE